MADLVTKMHSNFLGEKLFDFLIIRNKLCPLLHMSLLSELQIPFSVSIHECPIIGMCYALCKATHLLSEICECEVVSLDVILSSSEGKL